MPRQRCQGWAAKLYPSRPQTGLQLAPDRPLVALPAERHPSRKLPRPPQYPAPGPPQPLGRTPWESPAPPPRSRHSVGQGGSLGLIFGMAASSAAFLRLRLGLHCSLASRCFMDLRPPQPKEPAVQFRIVADFACQTGENPLWHPDEKKLYWTDIPTGRLFRYDPATDHAEQIYEGRYVGGFTFQEDGSLLLFRDHGNVVVWRDGQVQRTVLDEIGDERDTRFNDVMADPEGRVFCGAMPKGSERLGRLYRLDPDGSYRVMLENIGCANGMGFTLDGKQMYFTDTKVRTIWIFDYNRATGELSNQRPFIEVPEGEGGPDGMTVDANGEIWSARWGGSGIYHYGKDGAFKDKIELPAKQISSVVFGGEELTDLYATSAGAAQTRNGRTCRRTVSD